MQPEPLAIMWILGKRIPGRRRSGEGHRGQRLVGVVTGLTVIALAGRPILATAHLAAVEHVTCPEHGELLHADDPGAAEQGAGFDPAPQTVLSARRAEDGHDHDACLLFLAARERALQVSLSALSDPLSSSIRRCAVSRAGLDPAIATLRLAPKQSPPA